MGSEKEKGYNLQKSNYNLREAKATLATEIFLHAD